LGALILSLICCIGFIAIATWIDHGLGISPPVSSQGEVKRMRWVIHILLYVLCGIGTVLIFFHLLYGGY
jgi:hypothetical protein